MELSKQWYRFIHNCIAHPLLFFTNDSKWAVTLHDWSSLKMPYYEKMTRREWIKERARHTPNLDELLALDPDGEDAKAHEFMQKDDEGKWVDGLIERFTEILPKQDKAFLEAVKMQADGLEKSKFEEFLALDPDGEDAKAYELMKNEDVGEMIQSFKDRMAARAAIAECSHEWTCVYDDVGDPQPVCEKCGATK